MDAGDLIFNLVFVTIFLLMSAAGYSDYRKNKKTWRLILFVIWPAFLAVAYIVAKVLVHSSSE